MISASDFIQFIDALATPAGMAIIGLCIGSFLNVVIHRTPLILQSQWEADAREILSLTSPEGQLPGITLSKPASACPKCGHQIAWYENIPVLSWLKLKGRCSGCAASISWRYPLVEVLTATLFTAIALLDQSHNPLTVLAHGAYVASLIALAGIDAETQFLPDSITIPLTWAGILAAMLALSHDGNAVMSLDTAVLGAMLGYGVLRSIAEVFRLATGRVGMGGGDLKLLAAIGAWQGAINLLSVAVLASVLGTVAAIVMKAMTSKDSDGGRLAFGPYLCIAAVATLLVAKPGWPML